MISCFKYSILDSLFLVVHSIIDFKLFGSFLWVGTLIVLEYQNADIFDKSTCSNSIFFITRVFIPSTKVAIERFSSFWNFWLKNYLFRSYIGILIVLKGRKRFNNGFKIFSRIGFFQKCLVDSLVQGFNLKFSAFFRNFH